MLRAAPERQAIGKTDGKWAHGPLGTVATRAGAPVARALLDNEARVLARLDTVIAPRLVSVTRSSEHVVLVREFVEGHPLRQHPRDGWLRLLEQFAGRLKQVHDAGLVHGDLKPDNLIVAERGLVAIDWEHAMPIGADLASWPHRAVTLGMASPDLIWARGRAGPHLDWYALDQIKALAAADCYA